MSTPFPPPLEPVPHDLSSVQMGEGPPTLGELAKFYPARYSWEELKGFMRTGALTQHLETLDYSSENPFYRKDILNGLEELSKHTDRSATNYLVNVRLGWGTPLTTNNSPATSELALPRSDSEQQPASIPYFTSNISPDNVRIIYNDWPYSIPLDISHYVIWSRLPIVHPDIVHSSIRDQVHHDGLWGFSGGPPEDLISSPDGQLAIATPGTSAEARQHIINAGRHTHNFVVDHWPPELWEVAWFVNPPVGFGHTPAIPVRIS
ncbi:hypothetical protein Clacol_002987 [Clathrus columnatus]|uniref:Uncharacterized protein n=1 Tax=Clathrus columnatus TaxID=1419009 RepID=A0AAV5A6C1_9AGAM|nr:hypothetical protein Clacol_002987 [Clathrus columnatus]